MESLPQPLSRPRTGSDAAARVLTALIALVLVPLSSLAFIGGIMGLFSLWNQVMQRGMPLDQLVLGSQEITGLALTAVGIILLVVVMLTGISSSAGLLVTGLFVLVDLVCLVAPGALLGVVQQVPGSYGLSLMQWTMYGFPALLHLTLLGAGIALVIARRRPDPGPAFSVLGIVVVPLLFLVGVALLLLGSHEGVTRAAITFQTQVPPAAVLFALVGTALMLLGMAATRWSPWAGVLPALLLLALTVAWMVPDLRMLIPSGPGGIVFTLSSTLALLGGGVALALLLLTHTVVLAAVRHRSRRLQRAAAEGYAAAADEFSADGRSTIDGRSDADGPDADHWRSQTRHPEAPPQPGPVAR